jgi:molybdate transport system permease protein
MAGDPVNGLQAAVAVRHGAFELDVAVTADPGEVLAVVGPNGAGKSTLLRALAGLQSCEGRTVLDGDDITECAPERRPVGWVPQRGALFPHLSVLDNVAFGIGRRRGRRAAQDWLDRLGIGALAQRRPAQLSGGQAQKVAVARALARRPRLLLLDEPLSALDTAARGDVRRMLREHLRDYDGVTLLVTHDPVDAATLAGRLVAVEGGRVVQDDTVAVVARAPRAPWLAQLLGANACRGRSRDGGVDVEGGGRLVAAGEATNGARTDGAEALAVFAPQAVALHRDRPSGSARNVWPVVVRQLTEVGGRVRVDADGMPPVVAEVTTAAVAELRLQEGDRMWASVKATEVTLVVL